MKIILNYMQKSDNNKYIAPNNTLQLEVFLFKYLFARKLLTEKDFQRACGNSLNGCKFPVELQVKLKRAYARCLRTFLAENKDLSFLVPLQKEYPEHYKETEHYLKQFYYGIVCQLLDKRHTQQMKLKYAMMAVMLDFARKDKDE